MLCLFRLGAVVVLQVRFTGDQVFSKKDPECRTTFYLVLPNELWLPIRIYSLYPVRHEAVFIH